MPPKKYSHKLVQNRQMHNMADTIMLFRDFRDRVITDIYKLDRGLGRSYDEFSTEGRKKGETQQEFLMHRANRAENLLEYTISELKIILDNAAGRTEILDRNIAKLSKDQQKKFKKKIRRKVVI